MHPAIYKLILFGFGWLVIIYASNCFIAKRLKRVKLKTALVYFLATALIGLFGEIFLDTAYNAVVGHPLWYYNILPIYGGYTSSYAIVTWGLYGLHLYLLHDSLQSRWSITKTKHLVIIFALEALVLESLLTLSARFVFGKFLYYYLPGDLWHVTSVQNFPFYFICGLVLFKTLDEFKKSPRYFSMLSTFLLFVLLIVTH
jgi:hypothetical protein